MGFTLPRCCVLQGEGDKVLQSAPAVMTSCPGGTAFCFMEAMARRGYCPCSRWPAAYRHAARWHAQNTHQHT